MRDYRSEAAAQHPYLIANDQRDHKAWAKRIMYREQKGDTLLTHYQVKEARMAMNINPNEGKQ